MLKLGDRVKIKFTKTQGKIENPRDVKTGKSLPWNFGGENMWVVITGRKARGHYTGRLVNKPMVVDYKYNDKVGFHESEVLEHRKAIFKAKVIYNFINLFVPSWSR